MNLVLLRLGPSEIKGHVSLHHTEPSPLLTGILFFQ